MKRGGCSDQDQSRFEKMAQTQDERGSTNVKFENGGGSHYEKATCVTCGKGHYGEYL